MKRVRETTNILFCAQDAGGFNALLPVIRSCTANGAYVCTVMLAGASRKIAGLCGIPFVDGEALDRTALKVELRRISPSVIVLGTSGGPSLEKCVIEVAQESSIPTIAVLDFWNNYGARFNFDGTSSLEVRALPTCILVMDLLAKREMIAQGFPKDILYATGNPYFDTFRNTSRLNRDTHKIVFFDQALAHVMSAGWHEDYGYTETEVFADLLETLSDIHFAGIVYINFHPLNPRRDGYDEVIQRFSIPVHKREPVEKPFETTLREAGLFFGMTSGMLLEASLRNLTAVSYQPNARGVDPLISNRLKLSIAVHQKSRLKRVLKEALKAHMPSSSVQRKIDSYTDRDATGNVIRFITAVAKKQKGVPLNTKKR